MPYKFRSRRVKTEAPPARLPRILGVVALIGMVVALPFGWSRYQRWNDRRRLGKAQEAMMHGDFKGALLLSRSVVERGRANAGAQEIVDRATEALKAPEGLSWRRTTAALENGADDELFGIAEAVLASSDFTTASRALDRVSEAQRKTPKYHDLLAQIAAGKGDVASARAHWEEAARLAPQDERYQIQPIALRLAANDPDDRAEALAQLAAMKATDKGALPAQRALIADARRRVDLSAARDLAAELAAMKDAAFTDKIVLLDVLQLLRPKRDEEFNRYLADLQKLAAPSAEDVAALSNWLLDHDLAFVVSDWAATLPPEYFTQPPAGISLAQAYARTADWRALKKVVESTDWGDTDFLRLAFFALSLDRQGNHKASDTIWQDAFSAAQTAPDRLERLARACDTWGWQKHVDEVLWKLGPSEWCPRWVMDYLWAAAMFRKDTARLNEVAKLRLRMDPQNIVVRNNQANLALLVGESDEAVHRAAKAVHDERPNDPALASTYALSLFLQGKTHEAVAVMEAYPPEQLREPSVALYFGTFLAAAGQTERAPEFFRLAEGATKLPEESTLARVFGALCEVRRREQGGDHAGANAAWTEALRSTESQPALLDVLASAALEWGWAAGADAALLKLAAEDRCPPGAEENLWAAAQKTGDGLQMYRASRLLAKVRPNDVAARSRYVLLATLGRRSKESPVAMAEQLVKDFPGDSESTFALSLALAQEGKMQRALEVISTVPEAQRQHGRGALYAGIISAVNGRIDEARQLTAAGAADARYDEEKTLVSMIQETLNSAESDATGHAAESDAHWAAAMAVAGDRADWAEMLAKTAAAAGPPRNAQAALWKLAESENCPTWAINALWNVAAKTGSSGERYRASKLLAKSDPKNLGARCNWIILGLLTNQDTDAPTREAKLTYGSYSMDPGAAIAYALSLYLQKRREEALKIIGGLPAAQLNEPRVAFYFGVMLAATGEMENAGNYLRNAAGADLFPEERALASRIVLAEPLKEIIRSWPK